MSQEDKNMDVNVVEVQDFVETQPLSSAIKVALHGHNIDEASDDEQMEECDGISSLPFVGESQEIDGRGENHLSSNDVIDQGDNLKVQSLSDEVNAVNITPKKSDTSGAHDGPLTPTANLKVLLHAASPEIRSYERRKELFSTVSISTDNRNIVVQDQEQLSIMDCDFVTETEDNKPAAVIEKGNTAGSSSDKPQARPFNRKEKSLGLLCHRFLRLYPEHPQESVSICLDEAANKLCVGRRRIYDIINVLEAIRVVNRLAKNNYIWRGRNGLTHTLCKIRRKAELNGDANELRNNFNRLSDFKLPLSSKSPTTSSPSSPESASAIKRRNKSLGKLSEKFITLFLVQPHQLVSLDMAARVLITNGNPADNKYKTKVRRLYDIANILTSLKLIKKVLCSRKKPAFRWIGPEIVYKKTPVKAGNATSPQILMKSPLINLWSSPDFKMVLPVAKDGSLSSLCEVAEQERKDMCFESPIKRGKLSIATPLKGGGYMLVTPGKVTQTGSLEVMVSETDQLENAENLIGNEVLDSSFNSDEVFRQELELLRQRFPSPMSRLLSACNVEEALSQHKEKKAKQLAAQKVTNQKQELQQLLCAETNSPAKVSLAYLKQQQQTISKAVDSVTSGAYSLPTQADSDQGEMSSKQPTLPVLPSASTPNPKTIVCSDGRVLVPVSTLQLLPSNATIQPLVVNQQPATLPNYASQQYIPHSQPFPPHMKKVKCLQSITGQKPLIKISLNNQTVPSAKVNRPIKILINPSNTFSMAAQNKFSDGGKPYQPTSSFENASNDAKSVSYSSNGQKETLIKSKKLASGKNFVKIDVKKPYPGITLTSRQENTCKPVLTSLSSLNNCVLPKSVAENRGNVAAVVTNLVSRLEQHGYPTAAKQTARPAKIFKGVTDYSSALKSKMQQLQTKQGSKPVISDSLKPKKRKASSRKLNMIDENVDPEVLEIMLPSSPPPPVKPLPERPFAGKEHNDNTMQKSDPKSLKNIYEGWDQHSSAFRIAEDVGHNSLVKETFDDGQTTKVQDKLFCPVPQKHHLPSPLCEHITPSLVNTPINFPTTSRPTSSISSLGDLDHVFPHGSRSHVAVSTAASQIPTDGVLNTKRVSSNCSLTNTHKRTKLVA
uniref:Uncharacterized protein LOC100177540 n=1 Tax=Phallusia mammillata TaxID=59560 RepID=A0A6F9DGR2_9ASCI|nr:uncharacterized protein LOC100177540 [Phallusia mammillata]